MPQLILAPGNRYKKSVFSRFLPNVQLGPVFLLGSLIGFVALITVITLMFSTRQVTKGYVLNSLEAKHQDLVKKREVRDMEISKVRALSFIQESGKVGRMVKARNIVFINGETAIASR